MINKSTLQEIFDFIQTQPVLVVGDLMLDRYLIGNCERLNPEAPVPLVDIEQTLNRLGGAANVALNLSSLGLKPFLVGFVNEEDFEGKLFLEEMNNRGLDDTGIVLTHERQTTSKVRIYAQDHYLLRFDREVNDSISVSLMQAVKNKILTLMDAHPLKAVIIEDYDKGLLNAQLIQEIVGQAHRRNIPVMVDPKFRNFWSYRDVYLFKPNLKELNQALNFKLTTNHKNEILEAIRSLRDRMPHQYTLVTLAEKGMILYGPEEVPICIEGKPRIVKDVSGAGDTVISTFTAMSIGGSETSQAALLANLAGGFVCEQLGIIPITPEDLFQEIE